MITVDLIVDAAPVCSSALELLKVFSDPCTDHQTVDLKQMDFQIFLQQRWVYLGSATKKKRKEAGWGRGRAVKPT